MSRSLNFVRRKSCFSCRGGCVCIGHSHTTHHTITRGREIPTLPCFLLRYKWTADWPNPAKYAGSMASNAYFSRFKTFRGILCYRVFTLIWAELHLSWLRWSWTHALLLLVAKNNKSSRWNILSWVLKWEMKLVSTLPNVKEEILHLHANGWSSYLWILGVLFCVIIISVVVLFGIVLQIAIQGCSDVF